MTNITLQHELKKRNAFDSLEQEAALNLIRTADQIENRLGRLLREFGLTMSQYNVLRILRGEGAPLPSLEIADRMIRVVPAITGLIDRLEKQELVTRRRCEEDRRIVFVEITTKGVKLLAKIDTPLTEFHKTLLGHLSRKDLKELTRLTQLSRSATK
ncbi:MarR family winged helix-turn-helix transcriptional regulator [Aeoliella sp. SH292]|uniref:MarR family winged helix-turn-helix transcriptional regulator n=1 Tax=Aeoliella sp. SH292 TaxID=3454464 RepID=UPI003F9C9A1F